MRKRFRPAWKCLFLSAALLAVSPAAWAETQPIQAVAARSVEVSPNGARFAFVVEKRVGGKRAAGLRAFLKFPSGTSNRAYPLTAEFLEVVQSPHPSVIAFLTKEIHGRVDRYEVYVLDPTGVRSNFDRQKYPEAPDPIVFYGQKGRFLKTVKSGLQFSEDGIYLRYVEKAPETSDASADCLTAPVSYGYGRIDGAGPIERVKSHVKWLPPKRPAQLPAFLTEPQPKIHSETQPVWSHDSKTIHVHDKEGVWSAEVSPSVGFPVWRLSLPMTQIRAFQISPDGRHALLERGDPTRRVELIGWKTEQAARLVGEGRSARFSPDGKRFAYLNDRGAFIANLQDATPRRAGSQPQPNVHSNSRLQWSRDSRLLYVHDAEGVWSMEPDSSERRWTLTIKAKGLHTFRIVSGSFRPITFAGPDALPKIRHFSFLEAAAEKLREVAVADGNGGFVSKSPRSKNGVKPRVEPSPFGDSRQLKQRHLINVNLSSENQDPYFWKWGWESGDAITLDPYRRWTYHADSKGLYLMTTGGHCGLGFAFLYDE